MNRAKIAIEAATDGACSGNPGAGGWGALILFSDGSKIELGGFEKNTTNNRMELTAAIKTLEKLKTFKLKEKVLNIKKGPYGYYIQIVSEDKKKKPKNVGMPKEISEEDVSKITLENVINIIGIK